MFYIEGTRSLQQELELGRERAPRRPVRCRQRPPLKGHRQDGLLRSISILSSSLLSSSTPSSSLLSSQSIFTMVTCQGTQTRLSRSIDFLSPPLSSSPPFPPFLPPFLPSLTSSLLSLPPFPLLLYPPPSPYSRGGHLSRAQIRWLRSIGSHLFPSSPTLFLASLFSFLSSPLPSLFYPSPLSPLSSIPSPSSYLTQHAECNSRKGIRIRWPPPSPVPPSILLVLPSSYPFSYYSSFSFSFSFIFLLFFFYFLFQFTKITFDVD